jgi:hypothetical protein
MSRSPHKETPDRAPETSLVIHLWMESNNSWRGRVWDGDIARHFDDEQTLLEFIGERLTSKSGVGLPPRRAPS